MRPVGVEGLGLPKDTEAEEVNQEPRLTEAELDSGDLSGATKQKRPFLSLEFNIRMGS